VFKQLDTEENAGKTGYELLLEAKELCQKRFRDMTEGGSAPKLREDPTPKPKAPARESVQLPKTLADSIPADENPTNQDEFAHLDKMEGLEYEMALARLTPDQERRYLGGV
jgi:hypothetical protein